MAWKIIENNHKKGEGERKPWMEIMLAISQFLSTFLSSFSSTNINYVSRLTVVNKYLVNTTEFEVN